jgi:hypothetical protein
MLDEASIPSSIRLGRGGRSNPAALWTVLGVGRRAASGLPQ